MFALIYALIGILTKGFLYLTVFAIILFSIFFYYAMKGSDEAKQTTYRSAQHYPAQSYPAQRRTQYIPKTRYRQALSLPRNADNRKI